MPLYNFEIYDGYETQWSEPIDAQNHCAAQREAIALAIYYTYKTNPASRGSSIVVTVSDEKMDEVMVVRLACQTELLDQVDLQLHHRT